MESLGLEGQELASLVAETFRFETDLLWQWAELMLPPIGPRGRFVPAGIAPKEHPDIPGRRGDLDDFTVRESEILVFAADDLIAVPVVPSSLVGKQFGSVGDVLLLCVELGRPDNVDSQFRAIFLVQPLLLQFGGPPKTDPSRRGGQKDSSDLADVGVELAAQRLGVSGNVFELLCFDGVVTSGYQN